MLRTEGLTKDFGGLRAVDHCSLQIPEGTIFGLIGPNGSGKTTLFNLVTGFLEPTAGQVFFKDVEITGLPSYAIIQRGLARTFQLVRVFCRMTVMENLLIASKHQVGENWLLGLLRTPGVRQQEEEAVERAMALLEMVNLQDYADELCSDLSYGQQKLIEITRVLMTDPDLILLDEPAAGINPTLRNEILNYIRRLRDEQGKTFVLIEHDMDVIMNLCERIAVLSEGRPITEGTPEEVASDQKVLDAYLGGQY